MNNQLLDSLLEKNAKLHFKEWEAYLYGYNDNGIIQVRLDLKPGNTLPALYSRGEWIIRTSDEMYVFPGEITERYSQGNACMLDVSVRGGLYKCENPHIMSFDKDREAIIITSSSEKLVVSILKLDPNHAVVASSMEIPGKDKVWLRYKDLAIACFPILEHNGDDNQFIYELDFEAETLEKRGKIAEMILNDKL